MRSTTLRRAATISTLALVAALVGVTSAAPSGAAEMTFDACPAEVTAWVDDSVTAYPPYAAQTGDDPSALEGCAGSFSPTAQTTTLMATFEFPTLPTDPCYEIVDLTLGTSGQDLQSGGGWALPAYDATDSAPIMFAGEPYAGGFQSAGQPAGMVIPSHGLEFFTDVDQPATNEPYSVAFPYEPAEVDLDMLAAGDLGLSLIVVNAEDVVNSINASVTLDDAGCEPETTTTTTTAPPVAVAPPTTAAPAAAVATEPTFTG